MPSITADNRFLINFVGNDKQFENFIKLHQNLDIMIDNIKVDNIKMDNIKLADIKIDNIKIEDIKIDNIKKDETPNYTPTSSFLAGVRTLNEFTDKRKPMWDLFFNADQRLFGSKLYLIEGQEDVVNTLTLRGRFATFQMIRFMYYVPLTRERVDVAIRRLSLARWHALVLNLYGKNIKFPMNGGAMVDLKPFTDLVDYLKTNDKIGVTRLVNGNGIYCGTLYALPPCHYAVSLMNKYMPNFVPDTLPKDYILGVVIKGETPRQRKVSRITTLEELLFDVSAK